MGEVSVLPPPTNLTIRLTPQTLMKPAVQEIFVNATSINAWISMTPRRIIRTGIDGSIPISNPIQSGMRKYSNPDSSDSDGTRVTRNRVSIGGTAPNCGLNVSS